jgi:segregation and condensation protein B
VFDASADDDVSDGDEVDLPFTEEIPELDDEPAEDTQPEEAPEGETPAAETGTGDARAEQATGEPVPAEATPPKPQPEKPQPEKPQPEKARPAKKPAPAGRGGDDTAARSAVPSQARGGLNGHVTIEEVAERSGEELPGLIDDADFAAALEAILLVVDEPVAEMQLAQILEQPTERVAATLEDISARYTAAGHGFDLRRAAGGWRLYTRPEYAPYVERFVLDGQSVRLTQAALETLAVVAYKQPVTRSRISAIRGVNCDGVMRTLVTRGLIEEAGIEGETGAYLYRTTPLFLEKLGLNSVEQLPPLAPFLPDDVEEVLDASG